MLDVLEARDLHDGAFGREIALQADHAAGGRQRVCRRRRITFWLGLNFTSCKILGDGLAGHRHAVAMHIAAIEQRAHQHRHAARFPHILGDILCRRA